MLLRSFNGVLEEVNGVLEKVPDVLEEVPDVVEKVPDVLAGQLLLLIKVMRCDQTSGNTPVVFLLSSQVAVDQSL